MGYMIGFCGWIWPMLGKDFVIVIIIIIIIIIIVSKVEN